jgi:hypothetical protein
MSGNHEMKNAFRAIIVAIGALLATFASAFEGVLDEEPIPYATASEAAEAIRSQPGMVERREKLWNAYQVSGSPVYWIVFRNDSPFYPSVVRRTLTLTMEGPKMKYAVLCNADAEACATLSRWLRGEP